MQLAIAYVMVANTDDIQLNIHGGLMFTVQLSDREHSEIKNTAMFPRLQYIFFQTTASKVSENNFAFSYRYHTV